MERLYGLTERQFDAIDQAVERLDNWPATVPRASPGFGERNWQTVALSSGTANGDGTYNGYWTLSASGTYTNQTAIRILPATGVTLATGKQYLAYFSHYDETNHVGVFIVPDSSAATTSSSSTSIMIHCATTAALPSCTYANGSSGVGATLTMTAVGLLTLDTYAPQVGELILVKDQASALQNGLYQMTVRGSGGVAAVLTRHTSNDETGEFVGTIYTVGHLGEFNRDTEWRCTNTTAPTVGTDNINIAILNTPITLTSYGTAYASTYPTSITIPRYFGDESAIFLDYTSGLAAVQFTSGRNGIAVLPASTTQWGVVTSGTQTIGGNKTFNDNVEVTGFFTYGGVVFTPTYVTVPAPPTGIGTTTLTADNSGNMTWV